MDKEEILQYLEHLSRVYTDPKLKGPPLKVAIIGGAALTLLNLVSRVTKDIDLVSPQELPPAWTEAAKVTAEQFGLKEDWINQGPIDLLHMGLPEGFFERCQTLSFSAPLVFQIASRFDQIHFKLYASIDREGYHVQDLKTLQPTNEEMVTAARWCFTHDVSDPFRTLLIQFLKQNGWSDAARKLVS